MNGRVLLIVFMAVLLVSGCIKVYVREDIKESGMSDISMTMDMSNFPSMDEEAGEEDPCEDMDDEDTPFTITSCTYKDKIVTIKGGLDRSKSQALKIEGSKYRLDVMKAIYDLNQEEGDEDQMSLPEEREQVKQLKSVGVVYEYTVKMPGKVTNQLGGEIQDDGSVKFDILDLPDGAYVESETGGLPTCCIPLTTLVLAGLCAATSKIFI